MLLNTGKRQWDEKLSFICKGGKVRVPFLGKEDIWQYKPGCSKNASIWPLTSHLNNQNVFSIEQWLSRSYSE